MLKKLKKQLRNFNKNGDLAFKSEIAKSKSSIFLKNFVSGFTLVEALVAISILMIAIASPMTLAQKSLSTATLSKDQMIASFLVQDAIEAVKNIRDQTTISQTSGGWLDKLAPCLCTTDLECNPSDSLKFCTIDTTAPVWNSDSVVGYTGITNSPKLKISYTIPDINGVKNFLKYDYSGSEDSKFIRYINIRRSDLNKDEATVRVRVSWDSPQGVQNVDVKNLIYNFSTSLE